MSARQTCPNCGTDHDVGVFVSGQRVRCSRCGIRFEVQRSDAIAEALPVPLAVSSGAGGGSAALSLSPSPPGPAGENSSFATDATTVRAGLAIPGFEVLRTLGKGGMGEVYLAQQQSLAREVALKVLAPELARSRDFVARFEKEASALASLSHPNIVAIIDRGETGGTYYFAMEFVEGPSLRDLLREGPLAPARSVEIIAQICSAIDYAHSRGVIHRDLKPENILIDPNGVVKVADFGLAGIVGGDERLHLTRTDVAMGTFHYMAPEQRKSARDVDARADLFSLGVMLYELLTGEVPAGVFKLPSQRIEDIDPRIDTIVTRAMESNPSDRYQRASAIFDDLQAVAEAGRLATRAPGIPGSSTRADRPRARVPDEAGARPSSSIDSVVERTGHGLKRAAQILVAGLAVAALLVFALVGQEGRQAIRVGLVEGLGANGSATPGGEGDGVLLPLRAKQVLRVPVKMRLDGDDRVQREFDFSSDTSGEMPWFAYRGGWKIDDGALTFDVFLGGKGLARSEKMPRVFLGRERFFAEGFRLEATLALDEAPGDEVPLQRAQALLLELAGSGGEPLPRAKLLLYRNARHYFALEVTTGEVGGYRVSWNLGDGTHWGSFEGGSGLPEPGEGTPLHLALWVEAGWVFASVDGREIGRQDLGDLSEENWGKAGFACQDARCRFDDASILGRTRPPPSQKTAHQNGAELLEH